MATSVPRPTRTQAVLGASSLVCYAVGYPLAILTASVGSATGWALVTLGGMFLLALGVVTVQRVHRAPARPEPPDQLRER